MESMDYLQKIDQQIKIFDDLLKNYYDQESATKNTIINIVSKHNYNQKFNYEFIETMKQLIDLLDLCYNSINKIHQQKEKLYIVKESIINIEPIVNKPSSKYLSEPQLPID
ncbi:hypothetical protein QLL95_gp1274 [Cotonvirus japonicus]|uniref:Uncharacterized protein n=1 Tax=Cotonvirus japonicus TaxID=2811091 RepID=A0ABM7NRS4_9VIRU|nr:hypothetical protein QLL95_gp1274 [Cotonvirus japonicus]BCS82849.1 hypothetical protein [Cotonvirus japonicus]